MPIPRKNPKDLIGATSKVLVCWDLCRCACITVAEDGCTCARTHLNARDAYSPSPTKTTLLYSNVSTYLHRRLHDSCMISNSQTCYRACTVAGCVLCQIRRIKGILTSCVGPRCAGLIWCEEGLLGRHLGWNPVSLNLNSWNNFWYGSGACWGKPDNLTLPKKIPVKPTPPNNPHEDKNCLSK